MTDDGQHVTREPVPLGETQIETTAETAPPPISTTMREPTPEFIRRVCGLIGSGVSPYNASERWGVPRKKFQKWMRTRDGAACDALRASVREARAVLRAALEIKTAKEHPERALRRLDARDEQAEAGRSYSSAPRPYSTGSGHTLVRKAAPYLLARICDENVPATDLTPLEVVAREMRQQIIADCGGIEAITTVKRVVIDSFVRKWITASSLGVYIDELAATGGLVSRKHRRGVPVLHDHAQQIEIGRASCRERG